MGTGAPCGGSARRAARGASLARGFGCGARCTAPDYVHCGDSRDYISAESPSLGADGSLSALTVSASTLRCADVVAPHASVSREADMNGTGAVRGGPGKVWREAHSGQAQRCPATKGRSAPRLPQESGTRTPLIQVPDKPCL